MHYYIFFHNAQETSDTGRFYWSLPSMLTVFSWFQQSMNCDIFCKFVKRNKVKISIMWLRATRISCSLEDLFCRQCFKNKYETWLCGWKSKFDWTLVSQNILILRILDAFYGSHINAVRISSISTVAPKTLRTNLFSFFFFLIFFISIICKITKLWLWTIIQIWQNTIEKYPPSNRHLLDFHLSFTEMFCKHCFLNECKIWSCRMKLKISIKRNLYGISLLCQLSMHSIKTPFSPYVPLLSLHHCSKTATNGSIFVALAIQLWIFTFGNFFKPSFWWQMRSCKRWYWRGIHLLVDSRY